MAAGSPGCSRLISTRAVSAVRMPVGKRFSLARKADQFTEPGDLMVEECGIV
jgi:hypothetical protein